MTVAELKYKALREKVMRRARALKRKGFIEGVEILTPGSESYLRSVTELRKASFMQSLSNEEKTRAWQHQLRIAQQLESTPDLFLSDRGRISKATRKAIAKLKQKGYTIGKGNIDAFGRFMNRMRAEYGKRMKFSEEMVEFFDSLNVNAQHGNVDDLVTAWEEYRENGFEFDTEQARLYD